MKFSTQRIATAIGVAAALTVGTVSAGGHGGSGYKSSGACKGMGYMPGGGYASQNARPPMMPPQRPQRPLPPRPPMMQRYGYGAPMQSPYAAGGYAQAPAPAATASEGTTAVLDDADVTISNMRFGSGEVTIKAGGTVTWTNSEGAPHTVTANDGSFGSEQLGTGGTYSKTFDQPGTYNYYCKVHPMMRGTVVVVDS